MGHSKIKTLSEQVEYCLMINPETRNSDKKLTIILWLTFYNELIEDNYINLDNIYKLPSQDGIKRIRAKLQNTDKKYLPTNKEVAQKRGWEQEKWRSALGYNPELRETGQLF